MAGVRLMWAVIVAYVVLVMLHGVIRGAGENLVIRNGHQRRRECERVAGRRRYWKKKERAHAS